MLDRGTTGRPFFDFRTCQDAIFGKDRTRQQFQRKSVPVQSSLLYYLASSFQSK